MTTLTEKFAAFEAQSATQDAALQVDLNAIREQLELTNAQLDTIILNAATNTRYLLQAISQNSPCAPCPTPPITIPPVGQTPVPVNADFCKRSQAFLQMIGTVAEAFDQLMNLNVVAAWTLISDVYSQIIDTLGATDTIPLPSFPEAVNIAGNYFSFAASRLFSGETLSGVFSAVLFDLRDAIYSSGSPENAKVAYEGVIDASSMSTFAKLMLKAMAYSALYTYFFSSDTEPNLAGFDGEACTEVAPGTCFERISELSDVGGGLRQTILMPRVYDDWIVSWPDAPPGDNSINLYADAHPGTHITATPLTISSDYRNVTLNKYWFSREGDQYTLLFCPPEV